MTKLKQVVALTVVALVSFSVGKFLTPVKTEVKEVEKIVYREKSDSESDKNKHTRTRETIHPDGTRTIDTTTSESSRQKRSTDKSLDSNKEKTATTENRKDWFVSVLYVQKEQLYSVSIQRRIISEIYLGGFVTQDRTYGISIGVGF